MFTIYLNSRYKVLCATVESDSDSEHALAQLKAKQSTVGDTKSGAGRFGDVGRQHRLSAVPCPSTAAELPNIVKASSCAHSRHESFTFAYYCKGIKTVVVVLLTCVQVSYHVDAGSDGHGTINKGRAGLDTQVLVVQEHPPASMKQQATSIRNYWNFLNFQIEGGFFWSFSFLSFNKTVSRYFFTLARFAFI